MENQKSYPPSAVKRKHTTLSLEVKIKILVKIIDAIELQNEKQEVLAKRYGVGRSTIHDIYKNKENIKVSREKFADAGANIRQTVKAALFPKLEAALFIWIVQQRVEQHVLSPDILKVKAEYFYDQIYDTPKTFKASNGWYQRFRNRYGLRMVSLSGEKASADVEAFNRFKDLFAARVKEMSLQSCQIYNADESALFLKLLPNRTVALRDEDVAAGHTIIKTQCTFMPCANRDGSNKLPLMFLGTAKNPRSLPRDKSSLPVYYRSSKKAWMNRYLFKEWFHEQFVPSVQVFSEKQGIDPVALLLLDNCSAHIEDELGELSSADGKITVMFLPPNCTSIGQPMDQGVINSIKKRYKKTLLMNVVLPDDDMDFDDRLKRILLLDSIIWVAQAWDDVPSSVICNSWNKLWKPPDALEDQTEDQLNDDEELNALIKSVEKVGNFSCSADEIVNWQNDWVRDSLGEWVTGDTTIYSDREIIDYVKGGHISCEQLEAEDDSWAEEWLDEENHDAGCTGVLLGILHDTDRVISYLNAEGMVEDTVRMKMIKNKIMQHEFAKRV